MVAADPCAAPKPPRVACRYVGGLRRLTAAEREEWRRHGAPRPPAPGQLAVLEAAAAAEEDEWSSDEEEEEEEPMDDLDLGEPSSGGLLGICCMRCRLPIRCTSSSLLPLWAAVSGSDAVKQQTVSRVVPVDTPTRGRQPGEALICLPPTAARPAVIVAFILPLASPCAHADADLAAELEAELEANLMATAAAAAAAAAGLEAPLPGLVDGAAAAAQAAAQAAVAAAEEAAPGPAAPPGEPIAMQLGQVAGGAGQPVALAAGAAAPPSPAAGGDVR